ncbi:CSEP0265 putative effector protein [Blumeria hordei DH14]|uniref:CSEP0265 putative effector protein n=1 Tax=Blumeria graminis f. sp. hordei (strain DH14) TaxID=546991 RepID=N1JMF1_BLUG1|nr:CSEP0265 putative effector protein [Blumeria hordei DH14]
MKSYIFNFFLTIVVAIMFAATADARSVRHSGLSIIGRRGMMPEHTGYQCASTKYNMYDILDTIGIACPNPEANNNFWYSVQDCSFPKTFPEAKKLGLPKNTLMAPIRGSFFGKVYSRSLIKSLIWCPCYMDILRSNWVTLHTIEVIPTFRAIIFSYQY